jgi:hypothetical protein
MLEIRSDGSWTLKCKSYSTFGTLMQASSDTTFWWYQQPLRLKTMTGSYSVNYAVSNRIRRIKDETAEAEKAAG